MMILTCVLWMMIYIQCQQVWASIRILSKNACLQRMFKNQTCLSCLRANSFQKKTLPVAHLFWPKNLACRRFISVSCLVCQFICIRMMRSRILNDRNDTICKKQQLRKCQMPNLRIWPWCERCLLITESPKTPGHFRYLIWVLYPRLSKAGQVEDIRRRLSIVVACPLAYSWRNHGIMTIPQYLFNKKKQTHDDFNVMFPGNE